MQDKFSFIITILVMTAILLDQDYSSPLGIITGIVAGAGLVLTIIAGVMHRKGTKHEELRQGK